MMVTVSVKARRNAGSLVPLVAGLRRKGYRLSGQSVLAVDADSVHYALKIHSGRISNATDITRDMHAAVRDAGMAVLCMGAPGTLPRRRAG